MSGGDDRDTLGLPSGTDPDDPAATQADPKSVERSQSLSVRRGAALGRYLVVDQLGAGAMGVVLRAYDPDLDRSVAIKVVATDQLGGSVAEHERTRLMREAQAIARLSHPNVVTVYDVGTVGESVYVAMEFIAGVTLRGWKDEDHALEETLDVFTQAGQGLAAAHRAGLVHRDFKPDNVMIPRPHEGPSPRVRVLDFGLARMAQSESSPDVEELKSLRSGHSGSLDRSMTVPGTVMGTPAYMSPEQHLGQPVTAASDQFGFCVALFEAIYGRRPFAGKTLATLAANVLAGAIDKPDGDAEVPAHVRDALDRGLSTNPEDRFESMDALLVALAPPPSKAKHLGWAVAALGGAGLATLMTLSLQSDDPAGEAPPLCQGAAAKMSEVWSEEARQVLATEFEATGRVYATDVWTATATILDERAEAWIAGRTDACKATQIRAEQSEALLDRRIACYDRQLRRTSALLNALRSPDDDALRSAIDAAMALPSIDRCADADALMGSRATEVPPGAQEQVDAVLARLDTASAELSLGHFGKARDALGSSVDEAREIGHPTTLARALDLQATIDDDTGDPKAAAVAAEEAFTEAIAGGDDRFAADVARMLAFHWGHRLSDVEAGRRWLAIGRAHLRRIGGDGAIEASLWSSNGAIETTAGNYAAALEAHEHAREYYGTHAPGSAAMARTLNDIGSVYVQLGQPERGAELHGEAVRLKEKLYGTKHPETAAALRELGTALSQAEKFDDAEQHLRRALDIERGARGNASIKVATLLDDMGRIARAQGKLDEAIEMHREALEVWEAALGDPHPDLGVSILNVGYTLSAGNRFEEALAEFERALAMFQATVGDEHAYVVYASNSSASALVDLRRYDEALVHVERVLSMRNVQADPTLIAETKFMGAHALWGDGNPSPNNADRARKLAGEARDAYAAGHERWKPWVERIDTWLAEHP